VFLLLLLLLLLLLEKTGHVPIGSDTFAVGRFV